LNLLVLSSRAWYRGRDFELSSVRSTRERIHPTIRSIFKSGC